MTSSLTGVYFVDSCR